MDGRDSPILVVEDDFDSRTLIATALGLEGYDVITAANGKEGLTRAREGQPCLILLDLMMPVMDGEEFLVHQLADSAIRDIPVIVVTAVHSGDRLAQLGALCCIQKPVEFDDLLTLIESATASCRSSRGIRPEPRRM